MQLFEKAKTKYTKFVIILNCQKKIRKRLRLKTKEALLVAVMKQLIAFFFHAKIYVTFKLNKYYYIITLLL